MSERNERFHFYRPAFPQPLHWPPRSGVCVALPAVVALAPEARTRRVHYDWMEAGEQTQRTVASLSQQLRRFLDDQAWLENRRIMEILHGIESKALALREQVPSGSVMGISALHPQIDLAMERPLFSPSIKAVLARIVLLNDEEAIDAQVLFDQVVVDKTQLSRHIRNTLQQSAQVSLFELIQTLPLQQGLAELVAYLQLAAEEFRSTVDEQTIEPIRWQLSQGGGQSERIARLPRIIFLR